MIIPFYKYQGTGNDFVMIDNRELVFPKENRALIERLCNRHFGIGADGLILLENDPKLDFRMVYYNSDGQESTMCGNGGRCIVAFANQLGIIDNKSTFNAIDGKHEASFDAGEVALNMIDVENVLIKERFSFANTGSPHHIELVEELSKYPVVERGREIRNQIYGAEGSNVNFVEQRGENVFRIRTYERGVEDETLACGTGVTAAAIAMHAMQRTEHKHIKLLVEGGELSVSFEENNGIYTKIILTGPADFVYQGEIRIA